MPEQCGFTQRDASLQVRGFCALMITQIHLVYYTPETSIFSVFGATGYYFVGIFFFYSGYAMLLSFLHRPQAWAQHFWVKKLVRLWLPLMGSLFLYQLEVDLWYYHGFSLMRYIELLVVYREGNRLLWYIPAIFIYYVGAWLVLKVLGHLRTKLPPQVLGVLASIGCFAAYYFLYRMFINRLNPEMANEHRVPVCLLLGMLWACFEPQLLALLRKKHLRSIAQVLLFVAVCVGQQTWLRGLALPNPAWHDLLRFINPALLVLLLCCIFQTVRVDNPVLKFLGGISGDIYIWHAPFLYLVCNDTFIIRSNTLLAIIYMGCTIGAAWLSHYANGKLEKKLVSLSPLGARGK